MDAKSPEPESVLTAPVATLNERTRELLQAPITPLLFRLAWPNMLIMLAQAGTALIDTWWLAKFGSDALAGMALVFPFVMLVGTVSGGSIGAGISAVVARALGARDPERASSALLHGIIVNGVLGALLSLIMLLFGRQIFAATGGRGGELEAALIYSNIIFAGNILFWWMNALMSVVRGTGNMIVPASVTCGGVVLMIPLSPCLIFGLGPFPEMGIAGSAVSLLIYYAAGALVMFWYILSGRSIVRFARTKLYWSMFSDILKIGAVGTVISLLINLTAAVNNAFVAVVGGAGSVAGYGTAARLEFLLVPLGFGLGGPLVAMVGTAMGAGDRQRARQIVLKGGIVAFTVTETVGILAALFPEVWLNLFTHDPQAVAVGSYYLRVVGPAFGFFGLGIGLYFALLGAGKLFWPIVGSVGRAAIVFAGGAVAVFALQSMTAMFVLLAIALIVSGVLPLIELRKARWAP